MLLAVDIGNTLTKFGVFDGEEPRTKFAVETATDDLVGAIEGRLDGDFESAIVCSVVPEAAERLGRLLDQGFGVRPTWIDSGSKLGLKIKHEPPESLGTDRLVNSFAAVEKYGTPAIVCSLGTATTIDFVNKKREMRGGLIAPGMALMAKALNEHTAKLPEIEVFMPDEVLGTSTEDAMRSGVYLSVVGLVENTVDAIRQKFGDAQVIATGGFAKIITDATDRINVTDEDLTLDGLRLAARKLTAKAK